MATNLFVNSLGPQALNVKVPEKVMDSKIKGTFTKEKDLFKADNVNAKEDFGIDTFSASTKSNVTEIKDGCSNSCKTSNKSSFGKKVGTAIASAVLPGLGQFINGQYLKAAGVAIGGPLLVGAATVLAGPIVGAGAAIGIGIGQIIDAYRNA